MPGRIRQVLELESRSVRWSPWCDCLRRLFLAGARRCCLGLTGLNSGLLPCHGGCGLLCLLLLGCDLLNLLCSLLALCYDGILIRYADWGHGFRFDISVRVIEDGLVRFRKIQLDFLIRLFPLRILRDELLLILIRKFCCLDAYSFRLCAGVGFECLFREHELPQLIPSFL